MEKDEVAAIVEREIRPMARKLGLKGWGYDVDYDLESDLHGGKVRLWVDYNYARISLNAAKLRDEAAVIRTLRHELFHIVLAPLHVWREVESDGVSTDRTLGPALDRISRYATEQAVLNLERMWDAMTEPEIKTPD